MSISEEQIGSPVEKFFKAVRLTSLLRQKQNSDEDMQKAQKALIKPYQIRSAEDFDSIEKVMIQIKFFMKVKLKYGLLVFKEVCKHLYYKRAQPETVMIRVNQEGKAFYVIIKGSVGINIFLPKVSSKKTEKIGLIKMSELQIEDEPYEYQEINTLQQGDSFGELALLDPTSKTTATVITKETAEFACLDKEQFQNILGALNQVEMNEKMQFVRNIHFLHGWFENDLKTLSFHFELVYFDRNDYIYKEDDQVDGFLYFLKKGEVSLMKKDNKKIIRVCSLCNGEIFGEEMYLGQQLRYHSALSNVQDTQLYKLSKADLDRRMWQSENRLLFKESLVLRWEWRNKRYEKLKQEENRIEKRDENLQIYLKPKTEIQCEQNLLLKFPSQPSSTKVSSYTINKPFNFLEPESTLEGLAQRNTQQQLLFQSKIKTRQQNQSKLTKRIIQHKKQMSSTGQLFRNKEQPLEKVKRINIQSFKHFLYNKFMNEEQYEQNQLPFNFINQDDLISEQMDNQEKSCQKQQLSQQQLYDDINQFAVLKQQRSKMNFGNISKFSSKDTSFKKFYDSNSRKSPTNISYEVSQFKGSIKFKRIFQYN